MPMKIRLLPLFVLLLCSQNAMSQTVKDAVVEDEPLKFYDVEIILFKNLQGPRGLEYTRPSLLPNKAESIVEIQSADSVQAAAEIGYELLKQDDFKLIEQVEKIISSPRYELMLHAAWRQPGLGFEESTPVWIRGGNIYGSEYSSIDFRAQNYPGVLQQLDSAESQQPADNSTNLTTINETSLAAEQQALNAILNKDAEQVQEIPVFPTDTGSGLYELEGEINVSLARFLHVNADLVFRKPRPVGARQVGVYNSPLENAETSKILENHRLQERRRMRSSRLHYLDSPHFSMLVMISPYEVETEELAPENSSDAEAVSVTPLTE